MKEEFYITRVIGTNLDLVMLPLADGLVLPKVAYDIIDSLGVGVPDKNGTITVPFPDPVNTRKTDWLAIKPDFSSDDIKAWLVRRPVTGANVQ